MGAPVIERVTRRGAGSEEDCLIGLLGLGLVGAEDDRVTGPRGAEGRTGLLGALAESAGVDRGGIAGVGTGSGEDGGDSS